LLPGYTMDEKNLVDLADFLMDYPNVKTIELLPFHKMGEYKWKEMNEKYTLENVESPSNEEVLAARQIFLDRGLPLKEI